MSSLESIFKQELVNLHIQEKIISILCAEIVIDTKSHLMRTKFYNTFLFHITFGTQDLKDELTTSQDNSVPGYCQKFSQQFQQN